MRGCKAEFFKIRFFVVASGLAALTGCMSLGKQMPVSPHWTSWKCDSQGEVQWRYSAADKSAMDVRLGGDDKVYALTPQAGAEGELFSDGVLTFHKNGDQGLVYWVATNDLIGRGCKAP